MSENKLEINKFSIGDIVQVTESARSSVGEDPGISDEFHDFNRDHSYGNLEIYKIYQKEEHKSCYAVKVDDIYSDEGYYWEELRLIKKKNQQWDN